MSLLLTWPLSSHTSPGSQICKTKGRTVATIMDLQGPEIRTSFLIDRASGQRISKLDIAAGDKIMIYGSDDLSEVRRCTCGGCHLVAIPCTGPCRRLYAS